MRLTWNNEYDDYSDERWLPYYQKVCLIIDEAKEGKYTQEIDKIPDVLEKIAEAMIYEASIGDFTKLEPTMRIYQQLLSIIKQHDISYQGFYYPEMVFIRLNALLYKSKKMNRKAADEYKQFFKLAHQCLLLTSDSPELSDEQKLFLYWYCIDGLSESAQTHMNILEINNCLSVCDEIITIAAYAKPIALISDGISERLGDTIADVAGVYCRNNRLQDGIRCYDEAIDIHNRLADKNGSDYHRARALWITVSKQLLIFSATGNLSVLTKAEEDANSLLSKEHIHPAICCIAQGALGLINMQKGAANEILGLKSSLERYIKKASRRFF